MPDRKALLRGVIDNPHDDAPRLVMADWFEENGEADRGEFIRVQIELAREDMALADEPRPLLTRIQTYRPTGDSGREDRLARMRELFYAHQWEWESDVAAWARSGVDFCRGFIAHLNTTVTQWLKGAAGLHRAAPVTDISLHNTTGLLGELAGCPHLARVSYLGLLTHHVSAEEGAALAGSPHAAQLRTLRLVSATSGPAGEDLRPLVWAPWPGLHELRLEGFQLADTHVQGVAANPASGSLLVLGLAVGNIGPAGAEALAGSEHLGRLALLSLYGNPVGDAGALALVRSPQLAALTHLDLRGGGVTAAGAAALVGEPALARLRDLNLSGGPVGDAGAAALAASPHVAGLRRLTLGFCGITDQGARALASSPYLTALRWLGVGGNTLQAATQARLRERFTLDLPM